MRFSYVKIDAFTAAGSAGNPAACVFLKGGQTLTEAQMQRIAREHKHFVSEVAFCGPGPDNSFALRYYSSECEVDFCGHATIGCMYYLLKNSPCNKWGAVIHTHAKGSLHVYNNVADLDAVFIAAPSPVDVPVSVTPHKVAEALGCSDAAISGVFPIQAINAGLRTLFVPMASLDQTLGLAPNEDVLRAYTEDMGVDIVLAFSTEVADAGSHIRTRVFSPKFGYLEDMATGSGNGALGYYMLRHGMWNGQPVSIEQNGERKQFNRVRLKTLDGKVLFGGSGTVKIEGHYLLDEGKPE